MRLLLMIGEPVAILKPKYCYHKKPYLVVKLQPTLIILYQQLVWINPHFRRIEKKNFPDDREKEKKLIVVENQEYKQNGFKKVESFVTKIVFKNFEKFNESILKDAFKKIPVSIMVNYLSKPILVDNENTFLYGIIIWSLQNKPVDTKYLLDILRACDYIKLTSTYVLYILPKLEEYFTDYSIKQFLKERRIICLEYSIAGPLWLEKTKPNEFNSMKKRKYIKTDLEFKISLGQSEKRMEDNKDGYSEQIRIHSGFTWTYRAKYIPQEKIILGTLEWKNEIWQPHFDFTPYQSIDLEIISLKDLPQRKRIEKIDAKDHFISFTGDSNQDVELRIVINLIEEFTRN